MELKEFQELIPDFLLYLRKEKNLADNTYRAYASDLKKFVEFWQTTQIQYPKTKDLKEGIKAFRSHLLKQKMHKSTVARKLSCFNSYENFLALQNIILNLGLIRPHVPVPPPQSLTTKEISFLLDELNMNQLPTQKPHRDKAILELLYATGIRCSELINIRLGDINIEKRSILIPAKRKKSRTVFFNEKAQRQLELYVQHERKLPENKQEFLFLNYRYQPMTSRSIQRTCTMFSNFLKSKKKITPQLLRHSFAIHLLDQGADIKTVQKLLGFNTTTSIEKYLR